MSASRTARWHETSEVPILGKSEVHVWKINLAVPPAETSRLGNFLSAPEREQGARFHFAQDQRRFVVRRAILRRLLAASLETKPATVQFKILSHGKPQVSGQKSSDGLQFSCSHSADLALVALARGRELGVDLEQHRPLAEAEELAGKFFSSSEISELAALPEPLKTAAFFNGWTRKEAFLKAIGLGLAFPLDRFSVALTPDRSAALLSVDDDLKAAQKWTMISLDVRPDYSAALVCAGKDARIKLFNWNSPSLD
jgi:4'-phosphopantetheinyl transferase